MRNASELFKSYAAKGAKPVTSARMFSSDLVFQRYLEDGDFVSGSVKFKNETSSDNKYEVGATIISSFTFSLNNFDGRFNDIDFRGIQIDAFCGYENMWDAEEEIARNESIKMGHYYMVSHKSVGNIINCVAYDGLKLLDEATYEKTWSGSIDATYAITQILSKHGLTLANPGYVTSLGVIITDWTDDEITDRQALSYIAQLCGCYARANSDGLVVFDWYDIANPVQVNTIFNHDLYTNPIVFTGVKAIFKDENGDDDYQFIGISEDYVLVIENPILTYRTQYTNALRTLAEKQVGFRFYPGSFTCLSSPCYEAGDVFAFADAKGVFRTVIATSITYTPSLKETIRCGFETEDTETDLRQTTLVTNVERLKNEIESQLTTYDAAYQAIVQMMSSTMGLYKTEEVQDDGSVIVTLHNKPVLEESDVRWVATANTFAVTTDGGQTWSAAVDKNGNILAQVLTAVGVNAFWVTTGTIRDARGQNWWNLDTGEMHISAESYIDTSNFVTQAQFDAAAGRIASEVVEQVGSGIFFNVTSTDNDNGTVTLHAHVYLNRNDATQTFAPQFFRWYKKTEETREYIGYGYEITVIKTEYGYGGEVEATFLMLEDRYPVNSQGRWVFTMFGNYFTLATSQGSLLFSQGHPMVLSDAQESGNVYPVFGYDYYE